MTEVKIDLSNFSTVSNYKPPNKFPQFYYICIACNKPFYSPAGLHLCPPCRRQIEASCKRR